MDPLDGHDVTNDDAPAEASGDETSDGSQPMFAKYKKRKPSSDENNAVGSWQQKFVCMQKHDSTSNNQNPNAKTIEVLQQMLDYYT